MLQQKIEEVYGSANKSEITVMELNSCEATSLDGLTDDYDNLVQLSLANNHLKTLKSFPSLKTLTSLNLKGNNLEGSLDHLSHCDQLKVLDLTDNKFTSLEQLEALKQCGALETLNLAGCPIASTDDYRALIFEAMPHLKCIDGAQRVAAAAVHSEGENGNHTNGKSAVNGEGDGTTDEAGVDQLLRDDLEDDDEEYNPEGEEEEDEDIDEEEDEDGEEEEGDYEEEAAGAEARGVKRKHEDEDPLAHGDESANGTH